MIHGSGPAHNFRMIRILYSLFIPVVLLLTAATGRVTGEEDPSEKFKVRVDVEEVRIDVVVLDWKGNQITDLTADDFTVLQDFVPQKINSCRYIDESMIRYEEKSGIGSDSIPARKDIQRTMLFVLDFAENPYGPDDFEVDDLKTFVENEMGPGYLAGIVQIGTMEKPLFTSDREELLSIINNWQWRLALRGRDGFKSYSSGSDIEPGAIPLEVPFWEPILAKLHTTSLFDLRDLENFKVGIRTLGHYVKTLEDMPGRKNLVIVGGFGLDPQQYEGQRGPVMDLLADEALRAGVVIHVLDPRGLSVDQVINSSLNYNILSKNTGGVTVNDNWWVSKSGISWLAEQMKGYYLISYTPPPGTFDSDSDDKFHRIKVRTNGWFREVHTRSGFYANPSRIDFDQQIQRAAKLDDTLNTPFAYDDLKINLAAAYSRVPDAGYSIQSWVYMNPTEFEYEPGKDDDQKMSLETLLVVENTNGAVLTSQGGKFDINEEADRQKIREKGLSFDVKLNLENPGGYFVRVIVKDRAADRVGNAYRFLEIPDLEQGRLALSSIFVRGNSRVEIPQESKDPKTGRSNPSSSVILPVNTPAVRSYHTGDILDWTVYVYNLKKEKDRGAEIKYRYAIVKNGEVYSESDTKTIGFGRYDSVSRIPITRRIMLGKEMEPGMYEFKITVTDTHADEKYGTAVRTFDFEILNTKDQAAINK